ncbi:MAG: capsule assembly Wzi family protein [Saprospiraceae bacterium]|nr:capsule assembly Wzi family protein [Saprospiraceae bacterium]
MLPYSSMLNDGDGEQGNAGYFVLELFRYCDKVVDHGVRLAAVPFSSSQCQSIGCGIYFDHRDPSSHQCRPRAVFSPPMYRIHVLLLLLACGLPLPLTGQVLGLDPGSDDARIIERIITKTGERGLVSSGLYPLNRDAVAALAMRFDTATSTPIGVQDRFDLFEIYKDNNEWLVQPGAYEGFTKQRAPIRFVDYEGRERTSQSHVMASADHARYVLSRKPVWKTFYRTPANLWETQSPSFYVKVNPLLRFSLSQSGDQGLFFANQRGIRIRGGIDERIYFATEILETQASFPDYVRDFTQYHRALPGNGLYKTYTSSVLDIENGLDYLNAQGYVGFRIIPHIHAQFGHGRHFIGQGYRSLLLSDFSNNYFYLKFLTRLGRFTYQNIFAELSASSANAISGDKLVPKKYMAAHYLGVDILPNLNIGLFESVVYNRSQQFELQYLNPVILYRSVEHLTGSPDNVLVGLNADWRFLKRFQLYGQVILDEFKFKEIFLDNRGWWANKYGFQAGIKAIDVAGIDHLDLQVEYNQVRPYTYQHFDSLSNYTHYNMPLAHPLGANFKELIVIGRYQPARRWVIQGRMMMASTGRDTNGQNYGSDLLRNYKSRIGDYDNTTGQGVETDIFLLGIDATYELFYHFYLQASFFNRMEKTASSERNVQMIGGGIRWNLPDVRMDF